MTITTVKDQIIFISDVDGVLTDGHFQYTKEGLISKNFGPDDFDALNLLIRFVPVKLVSGDSKGRQITEKRVQQDGRFDFHFVSPFDRPDWIEAEFADCHVIYMGDGLLDSFVFDVVDYSIAPANASIMCRDKADYVTKTRGGERAVCEAVFHILEHFVPSFDQSEMTLDLFRRVKH